MFDLATETTTTTGAATRAGGSDLPAGNASLCTAQVLGSLGDAGFKRDHGLRYPYVAGAMANGIASVELVEAMALGGMLGFFGAAGLGKDRVEAALNRLQTSLPGLPFGVNLIHSPNESSLEDAVARLFIQRGLRLIEASAYLRLTLAVVRFRVAGIHRDATGQIVTPNRIVAKVSRVEVATQFFSPPPAEMLNELVRTGELTAEQAALAAQIPVAQDVTAEADSAGHTDNRPLVTLLPTLLALRDRLQAKFGYAQPLRVGAAGGLSTPSGLAAAFAMGAAYVVTGSVNQACVESGSSDVVRKMLAQAEQADTAMAPAADMFEMGVKLQVLKRGTMFPMRAAKLWELYRAYPSLDAILEADRAPLEKQFFRATLAETWASTRAFWLTRDPSQVERAERDAQVRKAYLRSTDEIEQLRAAAVALRGQMEKDRVSRDQAVQTAISVSQAELEQLRATIATLRASLERASIASEQALNSARTRDRAEILQLQEIVRVLRDRLSG